MSTLTIDLFSSLASAWPTMTDDTGDGERVNRTRLCFRQATDQPVGSAS